MKNVLKTTIALTIAISSFSAMADNDTDARVFSYISTQHPQKAETQDSYKATLTKLTEKLNALKQTQDVNSFKTTANEARTLALQAKQLAPQTFTDLYDAKDNQREESRIGYQQYRLDKLAEKLDNAITQSDRNFSQAKSNLLNQLNNKS